MELVVNIVPERRIADLVRLVLDKKKRGSRVPDYPLKMGTKKGKSTPVSSEALLP